MKIVWWIAATAACSGTSRGLEAYRSDTQKVLDTRNAQLKACYDETLKADRMASGTVTLQFVVEKKTGAFTKASVDPANTTAPNPLWQCVLRVVDGLKLEPADKNEGRATFVYEFKSQTKS